MSRNLSRVTVKITDDSQHPFDDVEANRNINKSGNSRVEENSTGSKELTSGTPSENDVLVANVKRGYLTSYLIDSGLLWYVIRLLF